MRTARWHRLVLGATVGAALAAAFVPSPPDALAAAGKTYSVKSRVLGKRVADWTAEWWQWALSIPRTVNPITDATGAYVEVGQRGPVWFLGGFIDDKGLGSTTITRTATIPSGKALLCSVLSVEWDATTNPGQTLTAEQMRVQAADLVAAVVLDSLHATLDGAEIPNMRKNRVISPAFDFALPEDNLLDASGVSAARGVYKPAVSDGYWVFLRPLPIGHHTLRLQGRLGPPSPFTVDATYELEVVDHDKP